MSAKQIIFAGFCAMICIVILGLIINAINEKGIDQTYELAKQIVCTEQQLLPMKRYFEVCNMSGYFSSHCFDMAVINSCGAKK